MGSNPTLSASRFQCAGPLGGPVFSRGRSWSLVVRWYIRVRVGALRAQLVLRQYAADLAPSMAQGEMTEWSKVHAWKACVLVRVPWVRIPLSPYNPFGVDPQAMRYGLLPNPVRTGREQR